MLGPAVFIIKLSLSTLAFILIGWFGARDKRIGGLLLTFPLLNGIAMLTGADPIEIANTIYLLVVWNCILFFVTIRHYERLPPLPAGWSPEVVILVRALSWGALWAAGAIFCALFRDSFPSGWWLFAIQFVLAGCAIALQWRPPSPSPPPSFGAMWNSARGYVRVLCFVIAFLCLSGIAYSGGSARWVGWAGALPLPGVFALAMLTVSQSKRELASLGDTLLLGPILVIPFNWLLSRAIVHVRAEMSSTLAEIAVVVVLWLVAAGIVFVLIPPFAHWRDARAGGDHERLIRRGAD